MPAFRNRIIHDYLPNEFDAARLFECLQNLDDFNIFCSLRHRGSAGAEVGGHEVRGFVPVRREWAVWQNQPLNDAAGLVVVHPLDPATDPLRSYPKKA